MAQYKVPQDVEADDKLLGPFTFRQFIYLIVVVGLIAVAWGLFQLFPLFALLPLPFIAFFGALALPLKKDQPMETYLTALISFYLKPRKRLWRAGQPESTIEIAAPKVVADSRIKDISSDEAAHRLSFLSNLIDTNGQLISGSHNRFQEGIVADAENTHDMFESTSPSSDRIETAIDTAEAATRQEIVARMAQIIETQQAPTFATPPQSPTFTAPPVSGGPTVNNLPTIQPLSPTPNPTPIAAPTVVAPPEPIPEPTPAPDPALANLAEQTDLSVETIAKQAHRIQQKNDGEVFISLRGN